MIEIIRKKNVAFYATGRFISLIGDWFLIITLPYYVYQISHSTLLTGLTFLIELFPSLLFESIAGVFVDRWNHKYTMVTADLLRACLLLPLILVRSPQQIWIIYLMAFARELVSLFFDSASRAIVPTIVERDALVSANAVFSSVGSFARLVGPFLGGILYSIAGFSSTIIGDSISFLLSALLIMQITPLIVTQPQTSKIDSEESQQLTTSRRRFLTEWRQGLMAIFSRPYIRNVTIASILFVFAGGIFNTMLAPFIEGILRAPATYLGELSVAIGVGSLLGAALLNKIGKTAHANYWSIVCLSLFGIGLIVFIYSRSLYIVLPVFTLMGASSAVYNIVVVSEFQKTIEVSMLGRVFGTFGGASSAGAILGAAIGSLFADLIGIVRMLQIAAGVTIISALVMIAVFRRSQAIVPPSDIGIQDDAIENVH